MPSFSRAQTTKPAPAIELASLFRGDEHQSFVRNGGRPAALLVHGFPGTPAEVRPLAEVLHRSGWTVRGELLPGFGSDLATLPHRTVDDWVSSIRRALAELQRGHAPTALIGFSMGGALAIQASVPQPPDALVLLSPFYKIEVGAMRFAWPVVRRIFPEFRPFALFKPNFDRPGVRKGLQSLVPDADLDDPTVRDALRKLTIPVSVVEQAFAAGQRGYEAAAAVRSPALVLQGRHDDVVRPQITRMLVDRMGGSVRYHEIAAAHDLLQPDRPAWPDVTKLVLQFLGRFAPVSAPAPNLTRPFGFDGSSTQTIKGLPA